MNCLRLRFSEEKGQSLVETSLFLIFVFLPLLAVLVEGSQFVITQNRVTTAGREAARFGANGGQNNGMPLIALTTLTQTMNTDESVWDIWAVRGEIIIEGGVPQFRAGTWQFDHVYGLTNTVRSADDQAELDAIPDRILRNFTDEGNVRIVGTYARHNAISILGIDNLWGDLYTIKSLSVMRVIGLNLDQTGGCSAFPLAIRNTLSSANGFPGGFLYPSPPPRETDFPTHQGGRPLEISKEGDYYIIGSGDTALLAWNPSLTTPGDVALSLRWPGNSLDLTGSPPRGYTNPANPEDHALHVGDPVATAAGTIRDAAIFNAFNEHIDRGRTLRLIVWNDPQSAIGGFVVFRLHGYGAFGLLAEFITLDKSCGQVLTPPE